MVPATWHSPRSGQQAPTSLPVLLRDAGVAVFTEVFDLATGDLISTDISFKGPHPDLESDFALFCEVITGALS